MTAAWFIIIRSDGNFDFIYDHAVIAIVTTAERSMVPSRQVRLHIDDPRLNTEVLLIKSIF